MGESDGASDVWDSGAHRGSDLTYGCSPRDGEPHALPLITIRSPTFLVMKTAREGCALETSIFRAALIRRQGNAPNRLRTASSERESRGRPPILQAPLKHAPPIFMKFRGRNAHPNRVEQSRRLPTVGGGSVVVLRYETGRKRPSEIG